MHQIAQSKVQGSIFQVFFRYFGTFKHHIGWRWKLRFLIFRYEQFGQPDEHNLWEDRCQSLSRPLHLRYRFLLRPNLCRPGSHISDFWKSQAHIISDFETIIHECSPPWNLILWELKRVVMLLDRFWQKWLFFLWDTLWVGTQGNYPSI